LKVSELSNALIGTRAVGAQTGASLKVRELSNALIATRAVGAQTGADMNKLMILEFKKCTRTFLYKLIPFVILAPLLLCLVVYKTTPQANWVSIVAKCSVFIQMISFSYIVIAGCYAICREYKENTLPYLSVTQRPMKQILFSKYAFLLLQVWVTQVFIFLVLAFVTIMTDGLNNEIIITFMKAGIVSSIAFSGLAPAIIYVALIRRSFISSLLIFLFLFILTFPFSQMGYGYAFPHLLPLILVSKFLGEANYSEVSYGICIVILLAVFVLFFSLTIKRIERR
jgi:hypothetical protein